MTRLLKRVGCCGALGEDSIRFNAKVTRSGLRRLPAATPAKATWSRRVEGRDGARALTAVAALRIAANKVASRLRRSAAASVSRSAALPHRGVHACTDGRDDGADSLTGQRRSRTPDQPSTRVGGISVIRRDPFACHRRATGHARPCAARGEAADAGSAAPAAPPAAAAAPKPTANCNPPYVIDSAGHRQYKPECL